MERNKGIDIFRAVAILMVLVYHFYFLTNSPYLDHIIINRLISLGGEIGVTLFFIISGFGIYLSLDKTRQTIGKIDGIKFLKKRFVRILPQYYLSLLILLFLTPNAHYLSKEGIGDILAHIFLIHNFFPSTHGSISGVLWTLGVIFQFYLFSIILYKCLKRNAYITLILSIVITISAKFIIYHFVFSNIYMDASYYFIYGRQVITALDNFVIGMFIANFINKDVIISKSKLLICIVISSLMCIGWLLSVERYTPYSDSVFGYVWHSILAILLGVIIFCTCKMKISFNSLFGKSMLFIAKYQYGIYIWHFVIATTLLQNSSIFIWMQQKSFFILAVVLCLICIIIGFISTITLEAPQYEVLFKSKRDVI